jgi:hypothetical protein
LPKHNAYRTFVRTVAVKLKTGDTLSVSYCPAKYTQELHNKGQGENPELDDTKFIMGVVSGWDFTDEKDKPIPITEKFLASEICVTDRANIVKAIFTDLDPNAA